MARSCLCDSRIGRKYSGYVPSVPMFACFPSMFPCPHVSPPCFPLPCFPSSGVSRDLHPCFVPMFPSCKKREDGHPRWKWCTQTSLKMGHPPSIRGGEVDHDIKLL